MAEPDPGLRRVAVSTDTATVDLMLPARIPLAELLPAIAETVGADCADPSTPDGLGYQLAHPAGIGLDASMTLAQHHIRDGTLLVLIRCTAEVAPPSVDDPSDALCAMSRPWPARGARLTAAIAAGYLAGVGALAMVWSAFAAHPAGSAALWAAAIGGGALAGSVIAYRLRQDQVAGWTLGLLATGFAGVAGFLAVPDGPGPPHVLLAATAAAAVAAITGQLSGGRAVPFTAVVCTATLTAAIALAGTFTGAAPRVLGCMEATAALGLLGVTARLAITMTGLSDPEIAGGDHLYRRSRRAADWLTGLVAGSAAAAVLGAVTVAVATPRRADAGFVGLLGAALLLRARGQSDPARSIVLLASGILTVGVALGAAARIAPDRIPWVCTIATGLAAVALWLGAIAPTLRPSPTLRRCADLAEYLVLATVVPMAVWLCGFYGASHELIPF